MPLFEFRCRDCGKQSELLLRGGEKAVCPACGSRRMEKELSTFAAVSGGGTAPCGLPGGDCGGGHHHHGGGCSCCPHGH